MIEQMSHPSRVRELKLIGIDHHPLIAPSHPSWVRELKPRCALLDQPASSSHPSWVRELKLDLLLSRLQCGDVAPLVGA